MTEPDAIGMLETQRDERDERDRESSSEPLVKFGADIQNTVMQQLFGTTFEVEPEPTITYGRYEVSGRLGKGAMGVVFLARDPELERDVAIKVMNAKIAASERTLLVAEAKAMARLRHPNVVVVYDVGEQDGEVFVAMERIEGDTLRRWLDAERRTVPQIIEVYVQAARGLQAAHDAKIVHRDFKPDNVLVGDDGRVTVMDFGLARVKESEHERVAQSIGPAAAATLSGQDPEGTHELSGTPAYMAPEHVRGHSSTAASDQFSFCVALYEALFDERPFTGSTLPALLANIITGNRRPRPTSAGVPERICAVIDRGLERDPSDRYPSMSALVTALEAALVPRWRRYAIPLAGAVVVGSTILGAALYRGLERSRCDEEAAQVEGSWGAEARQRVRASMLGTGLRYAPRTFELVDARLSQWSESWREVREASCQQRSRDHLAARRLACLDGRLRELSGFVEVLATSPLTMTESAVQAIGSLPEPAQCNDDAWVLTASPTPADPGEREAVQAAREALSRAGALNVAGDHEQALEVAQAQLTIARGLGYVPLEAESMHRVGAIEISLGRYEQAKGTLLGAYALAIEADTPHLAFGVGVPLIHLLGSTLDQIGEARTWEQLTEGYVERLGDAVGPLAVTRLCHLAELELADRNSEAALLRISAARELAERTMAEDDLGYLRLLAVEAGVHHDRGDFERAAALIQRSVALTEGVLGPEHPLLVSKLNSLVMVLAALNRFGEAKEAATRALELRERLLGPDHPEVAGVLTNLANVESRLGELDAAAPRYERALELKLAALGPEHVLVLRMLQNMGVLELQRGNHERALGYFERATQGLEKTRGIEHPEYAKGLLNLATAHQELGDFAQAIDVLGRARAILDRRGGDEANGMTMAMVLFNLAESHRSRGQTQKATESAERCLSVFEALVGGEDARVGLTLSVLGELQMTRGDLAEATRTLERSVEILGSTERTNPDAARPRFALARLRWSEQEREEAIALATQARDETSDPEVRKLAEQWLERPYGATGSSPK